MSCHAVAMPAAVARVASNEESAATWRDEPVTRVNQATERGASWHEWRTSPRRAGSALSAHRRQSQSAGVSVDASALPCSTIRACSPAACRSIATQRAVEIVPVRVTHRRTVEAHHCTSCCPAASAAPVSGAAEPSAGCVRRAATSRAVKSISSWSAADQSNHEVALSWHQALLLPCCVRPASSPIESIGVPPRGEQQGEHCAHIRAAARDDRGGLRRALDAMVPGEVVVGAVAIVLAIRGIVLVRVADQVGEGEAIMRGDEVDAVGRGARAKNVARSGHARRDLSEVPASPRQKRRMPSRKRSFHSPQPGAKAPRRWPCWPTSQGSAMIQQLRSTGPAASPAAAARRDRSPHRAAQAWWRGRPQPPPAPPA